ITDAICVEIAKNKTDSVVMLHDYQLYLVSAMTRMHYPSIVIQQFIHIPWPDIRYWHFLPSNILFAIYKGLAGNDIIGFHTTRDVQNFLEGARLVFDDAVINFEESTICWRYHRIQVNAYPSSISVTEEQRIAQSEEGQKALAKILPPIA